MVLIKPDDADPPPYTASDTNSGSSALEPRYIYYRVRTPGGAIPSAAAFDPSDPYIGRLPARSIPPPHTVFVLKRCIASAEGFQLVGAFVSLLKLFAHSSATAPMFDDSRIVILGSGPTTGSTRESALVVFLPYDPPQTTASRGTGAFDFESETNGVDHEYIYYRLYTQTTSESSTFSFTPADPSLGRIPKLRFTPPHLPRTVASCIAEAEGKPLYRTAQVYKDMSADAPMDEGAVVALSGDAGVGATPEDPLVLVLPSPGGTPANGFPIMFSHLHNNARWLKDFHAGHHPFYNGIPRGPAHHPHAPWPWPPPGPAFTLPTSNTASNRPDRDHSGTAPNRNRAAPFDLGDFLNQYHDQDSTEWWRSNFGFNAARACAPDPNSPTDRASPLVSDPHASGRFAGPSGVSPERGGRREHVGRGRGSARALRVDGGDECATSRGGAGRGARPRGAGAGHSADVER